MKTRYSHLLTHSLSPSLMLQIAFSSPSSPSILPYLGTTKNLTDKPVQVTTNFNEKSEDCIGEALYKIIIFRLKEK